MATRSIPLSLIVARLLRPKQWIKNVFVLAPVVFAQELFQPSAFLTAMRALIGFSITASAVYIVNDIADMEADRVHPIKRHRPLAAGLLSVRGAIVVLLVLLLADAILVWGMDGRFTTVLVVYFLMNLAYSFWLKNVLLLDVFLIAAGFMLRVLGGAYAINVRVSNWLVLCSLFISLFLGFAKRRSELEITHTDMAAPGTERKVLLLYRVGFIDQMLTIAAAGAVISYALYTVAPQTVQVFGTDKMLYTTVFVLYGVFRYLFLIHTSPSVENPTNAVTSDRSILITGILWIASCIYLIYSRGYIPWPW